MPRFFLFFFFPFLFLLMEEKPPRVEPGRGAGLVSKSFPLLSFFLCSPIRRFLIPLFSLPFFRWYPNPRKIEDQATPCISLSFFFPFFFPPLLWSSSTGVHCSLFFSPSPLAKEESKAREAVPVFSPPASLFLGSSIEVVQR